MSNYDDYNSTNENNSDTEQHRSRRAKKQREEELARARQQNARTQRSEENHRGHGSHIKASDAAETAVAAKKYKLNKKQFLKFVICVILAIALLTVGYAAAVIISAPKIQTDNIYSMLSQSSVLYDDEGEIIDSVSSSEKRTIVEINQIPDHVQKAFIALEDKTFEKHHGFNIIRIFGAIK
ncbi:MAG: transglycosylase domain-containing protein, partial [Firmicutes bacterium]|nr:transglycosylase domain-containing protein [Bacillota bacterium]